MAQAPAIDDFPASRRKGRGLGMGKYPRAERPMKLRFSEAEYSRRYRGAVCQVKR